MQEYSIAFLWGAGASGVRAGEAVGSLQPLLECATVPSLLLVSVLPRQVGLEVRFQESSLVESLPSSLIETIGETQGAFIELWRMPESHQARFRQEHLTPSEQAHDLSSAATSVQRALDEYARSGHPHRQAPRFDCKLTVHFKTELDFVKEHATNISNGGLFVVTDQRPARDSLVELQIQLPNGELLQARARVAHVVDLPVVGGLGLAFTQEDARFHEALDAYLASLIQAK